MATRRIVLHIASCDVCGRQFDDDDNSGWGWDDTPELAIAKATEHPYWTVDGRTVICPASNPAHDRARGGESPFLLAMSPDAMTATFLTSTAKENQPA